MFIDIKTKAVIELFKMYWFNENIDSFEFQELLYRSKKRFGIFARIQEMSKEERVQLKNFIEHVLNKYLSYLGKEHYVGFVTMDIEYGVVLNEMVDLKTKVDSLKSEVKKLKTEKKAKGGEGKAHVE